jgi:hypothetical protein
MSEAPAKYDPQKPDEKYRPILRSWVYYIVALLLVYGTYKFFLALDIAGIIDSRANKKWVLVLPAIYLFCGVMLNILIMRKLMAERYLEYHQFSNTIENIFMDKLRFLFLWPIKYPFLLLKISTIERI